MSWESIIFQLRASKADRLRDEAIPLPQGVDQCRNVSYGPHGDWNLLDVYFPQGTKTALPTIVSIHGGGYVYGSKEIYRRYGMDMAKRGFAFVNFNYRLAPKWKFPTPLHDTNAVMEWICKNAQRYHLDPRRIILVGDSAGAQLASQYAVMATNPDYAAHFHTEIPPVRICCLGLYCGLYDMKAQAASPRKGLALDYLGRALPDDDPRFQVLENITGSFPPAFIATACHDFLRDNAEPMCYLLREKGIETRFACYGSEDNDAVGHVFHVNIALDEAKQCNDDSAAFFRQYHQ